MEGKRRNAPASVFEWIMIVLFGIVVAAIVAVAVYRTVISSNFNEEGRNEQSYRDMWERINDPDEIDYIMIQSSPEDRVVYNVPTELFDDLICDSFSSIDQETSSRVFREKCVVVFFRDESFTVFNIDGNGKVYWAHSLKVTCPSLVAFLTDQP